MTISTKYIHGHGVGTELYIEGAVKVVDCLNQADAADLKEIVHIFAAGMKTLDYA